MSRVAFPRVSPLQIATAFIVFLLASPALAASSSASSVASNSTASSSDGTSASHSAGHPQDSLIFLWGAIPLGVFVLHLTMHPWLHSLPITVVIFALGIATGILEQYGAFDGSKQLLHSYYSWVDMDAHLLLFTLLPPLLCGDAMTIDMHVAKKTAWQCLILAGPGVAVGSFATAAVCYYVLPYNWDFSTSLTVGSILAATDPVAVVSLLKDLGASPVLTMQIQGESLLNDGTAIVLFTIAYDIKSGKTFTVPDVLLYLFNSTVGAGLLGASIGFFFFLWIRSANDKLHHSSALIQVSLTFVCAYWAFFIAEGFLHISGVLSTVAAALVLAQKVWPVLVSQQGCHEIWHVVEFLGNAIVFFLAGVMTGRQLPATAGSDYLWLFVVFTLMILIRLVMLLAFWPLLNLVGRRVSLAEVLVMTWGGLRGMVGLALAILVSKERAHGELSQTDGDRILFLVGGVAALTLLVNATTAPALCIVLGVTQAPEERKALVRNLAKLAHHSVTEMLEDVTREHSSHKLVSVGTVRETVTRLHEMVMHHLPHMDDIDHEEQEHCETGNTQVSTTRVSRISLRDGGGGRTSRISVASLSSAAVMPKTRVHPLFVNHHKADIDDLWRQFDHEKKTLLQQGADLICFQFGHQLNEIKDTLQNCELDDQKLKLVREAFLEAVRADYWEQLQRGKLASRGSELTILLNSVNLAKERCGSKLSDWEAIEGEMSLARRRREDPSGERVSVLFSFSHTMSSSSSASATRGPGLSQKEVMRRAATGVLPVAELSDDEQAEPICQQTRAWLFHRLERLRISRNFKQQMQAVQVIGSFIEAHYHAQTQIASYFGEDDTVDTPEEAYVIIESQTEVFKALGLRNIIDRTVQKKANTIFLVNRLVEHYRHFVLRAVERGVLQAKEAEVLIHPVAAIVAELRRERARTRIELTKDDAAAMIQQTFRAYLARQAFIQSVNTRGSATGVGRAFVAVSKLIPLKVTNPPGVSDFSAAPTPTMPPPDETRQTSKSTPTGFHRAGSELSASGGRKVQFERHTSEVPPQDVLPGLLIEEDLDTQSP